MILTERERSELLLHLSTSTHWMRLEAAPGERIETWVRLRNGEPDYVVQLSPEQVWPAPVEGTLEPEKLDHFVRMLQYWTSYGIRARAMELLLEAGVSDANVDELSRRLADATSRGEDVDTNPARSARPEGLKGLYKIEGGGYVQLDLTGACMRATLSFPAKSSKRVFGTAWQAVLTPVNGNTQDAGMLLLDPEASWPVEERASAQITHTVCGGVWNVVRSIDMYTCGCENEAAPLGLESTEIDSTCPLHGDEIAHRAVDVYKCTRCGNESMQPDSPELEKVWEEAVGKEGTA